MLEDLIFLTQNCTQQRCVQFEALTLVVGERSEGSYWYARQIDPDIGGSQRCAVVILSLMTVRTLGERLYCFNPFLSTPTADTRDAGSKGLTKGAWTRDLSLWLFHFSFRQLHAQCMCLGYGIWRELASDSSRMKDGPALLCCRSCSLDMRVFSAG